MKTRRHFVGYEIDPAEAGVIRAALLEFVRRNRVDLLERFMRDDIQWALM